jgi:hypothetical protein
MARFPKLKLKDPFAKAGMASWKKWSISIASVAVIGAGLWLGNLLSWANLPSPLKCFQKTEVEVVVEEVAVEAAPAEQPTPVETENVNN